MCKGEGGNEKVTVLSAAPATVPISYICIYMLDTYRLNNNITFAILEIGFSSPFHSYITFLNGRYFFSIAFSLVAILCFFPLFFPFLFLLPFGFAADTDPDKLVRRT